MRRWLGAFVVFGILIGLTAQGAWAGGSQTPHLFTVVFTAHAVPDGVTRAIEAAGGTVVASVPEIGGMLVSGPASLMGSLGARNDIQAVSPATQAHLAPVSTIGDEPAPDAHDPASPDLHNLWQWDIKQVTMNGSSYQLSTGSHRTVVGIIDTGVSTRHPDLMPNLMGGRSFVADGPGGTVVPGDIEDRHGHGSHVAGTIAGHGRILGVGPDLGLRAYRVFGAMGGASFFTIVQALIAAANDRVDVISMSLGGYDVLGQGYWTDPDTGITYRFRDVADFVLMKRAVRYAISSGAVVVAAAGNDATDIGNPAKVTAMLNAAYGPEGYRFVGASREAPGTLPGVVTVSATGPDRSLSSYSNYGAIDLAAPGGDFQRYPDMTPTPWYTDMCFSAYRGVRYAWMAGTSMATPKVTAVAALVIDAAKAHGSAINPAQVAVRLQQTAVDLGKPGTDKPFGHGMVNAVTALRP